MSQNTYLLISQTNKKTIPSRKSKQQGKTLDTPHSAHKSEPAPGGVGGIRPA